jgi:hypothetical protein
MHLFKMLLLKKLPKGYCAVFCQWMLTSNNNQRYSVIKISANQKKDTIFWLAESNCEIQF